MFEKTTVPVWKLWAPYVFSDPFGLLPEARGLVTRGPYRLVRHPVYLGELTSALGLVIARPHMLIAAMYVAFAILQYWRTIFEERALSAAYPGEYPAYARQVPRLVPGLR